MSVQTTAPLHTNHPPPSSYANVVLSPAHPGHRLVSPATRPPRPPPVSAVTKMVSTRDGLLARTVGVGALVETTASRARDPGGWSGTLAGWSCGLGLHSLVSIYNTT